MAVSTSPATAKRYRKSARPCVPLSRPAQRRNGIGSRPITRIGVGQTLGMRRSAAACSPTEHREPSTFTTAAPAGTPLEGAAWYLHRQRLRPVVDAGPGFSTVAFHQALDMSPLKSKAKYTLLEMLHSADEFGRTTLSGRRLAGTLGVREATISSHLERARFAELLLTKRRYNQSSIHQLTWPGSGLHPPLPGVSPLKTHIWTDGELAWWRSWDAGSRWPTPWRDHRPPF